MSKLGKILFFAGSFAAGYFIGKGSVNQDISSNKYEVVIKENDHFLHSKNLDKSYILQEINKEVYMGDLEHMVNGVKNMYDEVRPDKYVKKR